MILEAAILTLSCVLFVNMGLSAAIQEKLHFSSKVLSCAKCCTFWSVLLLTIVRGHGIVQCIAASFVFSYAALWLSMLYDCLAIIYNRIYERITKQTGTEESPGHSDDAEADDTDAVS